MQEKYKLPQESMVYCTYPLVEVRVDLNASASWNSIKSNAIVRMVSQCGCLKEAVVSLAKLDQNSTVTCLSLTSFNFLISQVNLQNAWLDNIAVCAATVKVTSNLSELKLFLYLVLHKHLVVIIMWSSVPQLCVQKAAGHSEYLLLPQL